GNCTVGWHTFHAADLQNSSLESRILLENIRSLPLPLVFKTRSPPSHHPNTSVLYAFLLFLDERQLPNPLFPHPTSRCMNRLARRRIHLVHSGKSIWNRNDLQSLFFACRKHFQIQ